MKRKYVVYELYLASGFTESEGTSRAQDQTGIQRVFLLWQIRSAIFESWLTRIF